MEADQKGCLTIALDFTSDVINTYLTMVSSDHKVQPTSDFSFERMQDFIRLCERMETPLFVDIFRVAILSEQGLRSSKPQRPRTCYLRGTPYRDSPMIPPLPSSPSTYGISSRTYLPSGFTRSCG